MSQLEFTNVHGTARFPPDPYADYLIYDSFLDINDTPLADHAPEKDTMGEGWIEGYGSWTIQGNRASSTFPPPPALDYAFIEAGISNVIIEADVEIAADSLTGLTIRGENITGNAIVFMYDRLGGGFAMWEGGGYDGGNIPIGWYEYDWTPGQVKTMKLVSEPGWIYGYINNELVISAETSIYASQTMVGLFRMEMGSCYWDNFSVSI